MGSKKNNNSEGEKLGHKRQRQEKAEPRERRFQPRLANGGPEAGCNLENSKGEEVEEDSANKRK
jgi:hypothetical protein